MQIDDAFFNPIRSFCDNKIRCIHQVVNTPYLYYKDMILSEEAEQYTGGNCRTDFAGFELSDIGFVSSIGFASFLSIISFFWEWCFFWEWWLVVKIYEVPKIDGPARSTMATIILYHLKCFHCILSDAKYTFEVLYLSYLLYIRSWLSIAQSKRQFP